MYRLGQLGRLRPTCARLAEGGDQRSRPRRYPTLPAEPCHPFPLSCSEASERRRPGLSVYCLRPLARGLGFAALAACDEGCDPGEEHPNAGDADRRQRQ